MKFKNGDLIGDFTVLFPISAGNVFETYRVKGPHGKSFLKLWEHDSIDPYRLDEEGAVIEIETARQLDHHNLGTFESAGTLTHGDKRYNYFTTDFMPGETLSSAKRESGRFGVYETRKIALAVLSALEFLHSLPRPVIHNAVNPTNILLNSLTEKLDDLRLIGLSHARYADMAPVKMPLERLNPFYMAPERLEGVSSVQTDVFSVGALLYNLIFDRLPWECDIVKGNEAGLIAKINARRQKPLDIPEKDIYGLDTQLVNIIRKALSTEPADRFSSAREFIDALEGKIEVSDSGSRTRMKMGEEGNNKDGAVENSTPGEGFDAIAGMEDLKKIVREEVIDAINRREEYERYGVSIPNGMLLYGPPGCGKTFFAKQLAAEVGFNFMEKKPSDLQSKWMNETQENIADMFREAERKAPSIIFIDELNELTPSRNKHYIHHVQESTVNEFLAQMDRLGQKGIFVIGATNYPQLIDKAIMRSGRLDRKFYVGPPDFEARKALFAMRLKGRPLEENIDYDRLAKLTENYVFSDLELIINDASRKALLGHTKISMTILEEVIGNTLRSLSSDEIAKFEKIKAEMENTGGKRRRVGF